MFSRGQRLCGRETNIAFLTRFGRGGRGGAKGAALTESSARELGRTATLLLRAVLLVAVVEGGAVPGEDGDAETVLDR